MSRRMCGSAEAAEPRLRRRRSRFLARLLLAAVIPVLLAAFPSSSTASHIYKIGFIASITGPGASLGEPERDVARLLQDQLTSARGVVGPDRVRHAVEILIFDDQSRADTAASLARRLINEEKVVLLVAGTLSGPSLAMVPIATEGRTPMISMASARAIIEDPQTKRARPWIFKPVPENLHSAQKQAEYLKAIGATSVCHLYENTAYGQDTFASAGAIFPAAGITIVYGDAFDRTATEFPQVARVRASGCRAVVIGSIPPAASVINVAVRERAAQVRIVHGHGACSPDLIKTAGAAAERTVMPCGKILVADQLPAGDPVKTLNLKFISDFRRFTGGREISTFAGHAFDSLQWALIALRNLPDGLSLERQRDAAREALETKVKRWAGTHGFYTLSPEDHLGWKAEEFAFVTVQGGKFLILPRDQWK
ncbi:MAG: ABC transporter substrate-binding protein [Armatimonadota bacterium]|nr:ABC transporter substrate-binding protein [Armatimonadota bacterium]MDR7427563.1 ABC transporter substrate-binding protein [Armatimonadota bacterium]MDR7465444.1 ABC transporter substrate-binding protein [Armatimonadota bacterium]MDR7469780.1 ABC transporter substrate-binding protein [Armatimonadota bacterium]MDR7474679.1 ABC transporter substrate-binding protein [Armatimonadota bacterium]